MRFCVCFCFRGIQNGTSVERKARAFVMRLSDDEVDVDFETQGEEVHNQGSMAVKRFGCDELYLRYVFFFHSFKFGYHCCLCTCCVLKLFFQ